MTKLHELAELGQSIWLDYIQRSLIKSGELQALIDKGLRGVTSNPSIFQKAISESSDYEADIKQLTADGKSVDQIYEFLTISDVRSAADLMRPVYDATDGLDGYVSLEVNPKLAYDTAGTIKEAKYLYKELDRPNVFIKVPATPEGIPAIKSLIGTGININVTLIFSLAQYEAVAEAYIAGLEELAASGGSLKQVASVASFFVSRIDTAVDKQLAEIGNVDLQGKIAIASAKTAYTKFKRIFSGTRWERLKESGARVQRPLWASTSTKNPAYPDTLYIDSLIGKDTVNTVPPKTLDAFIDHGTVAETVEKNADEAAEQLSRLSSLGIDLDKVTQSLLDAGVEAFDKAFDTLLEGIADQMKKLNRTK